MDWSRYTNSIPYEPHNRAAWKEEERRLRDIFKQDAFQELGIAGHPKRDLLFQISWDRGHSNGYSEVWCEMQELVELIRNGD